MSTHIILIDHNVPQHWDYAKQNGFWDLQKDWQGLIAGDEAYFWITGTPGRVVGRARLTSGKVPLPLGAPHAWSPRDSRRGDYHFRIQLADFEDIPVVRLKWGEVRAATNSPGRLNPVTRIPDAGVSWLRARLGMATDPYDEAITAIRHSGNADIDIEVMLEDRRVRVPASVVVRRGARAFRDQLLTAYAGRCAVTGTSTAGVLEAAHMSDYKGDQTDRPYNGLLLRADIHTLFDLNLLTITTPDYTVHVAPEVKDSTYRDLHGKRSAVLPASIHDRPHVDLLAKHNSKCDWLAKKSK
ncbi:HNH endonuclease [Janibacter sp. HTCC2649]|uniref:HNH endonuclease n=1 Tax=Janibacter sp. HTCC2649 TaxID=313589 RepID=UPI00192A7439|nr:HNH endonuclease [Janibacter sp. HTCC2649]